MEVYIARQPIFNRNMDVYGYELLYRRSINNFYEGKDDNSSTAELINNAFLTMRFEELTGGTRGFINFSEEMIENEIHLLLPKEVVIIEILERVKVTDKVIEACKKMKRNGYKLALDDFVFDESYLPLIEIADIIKIEFTSVPYESQRELIKKYGYRIKFLAEKIETREEYQLSLEMGYDYFQGYFFSKPVIVKSKELVGLNVNLVRILDELNKKEPRYQRITEIIESDLGLSFKLLKIVNAVIFGSRRKIYSIKQALVMFGIDDIKKWIYLLMLKETQNNENKELIKSSLVRGKLMELMAFEIGMNNKHFELYLTGMFASIDVLLDQSMEEILKELPFDIEVKNALLGQDNEFRKILDIVLNYEMLNWSKLEGQGLFINITQTRFMDMYIEALKWVMELNY